MVSRVIAVVLLVVSVVATAIFVAAIASPKWLSKDYTAFIKGSDLNIASPYHLVLAKVDISSDIGLFSSCFEESYTDQAKAENIYKETCDDRDDWQKAAMVFGIVAIILQVLCLVLALVVVVVTNKSFYHRVRYAVTIVYFITSIATLVPVLLFGINKREMKVKPPLSGTVNYDMEWGFYLAIVTSVTYVILTVLYLVLTILRREEKPAPARPVHGVVFRNEHVGYY